MSQRNPFDELESFFERMSRQFDTSPGQFDWNQWARSERPASIDLVDRGEDFVVAVDLPGFDKDDVDVRLTEQTLHITADREEQFDESSATFVHQERSRESVSRRIDFPEPVDADAVDATLSNGVLTVTIGKAEPVPSGERIDIE